MDELEMINVIDVNRYKKLDLQAKVQNFITHTNKNQFTERINLIMDTNFYSTKKYPMVFEISGEYAAAFSNYFRNKM